MSLLIKGMKMPTRCEDCPMGFSVNFGILCTPTHNIVGDGEISKKQNWCPLIELPPHGKWIGIPHKTVSKRNRTIHSMVYICPLCRYSNGRHKSNFCPNCGTELRGREDA